jgi:hypothetical protein
MANEIYLPNLKIGEPSSKAKRREKLLAAKHNQATPLFFFPSSR